MWKLTGWILMIAAVFVSIAAIIIYYPKFADYKKERDLYNDLSDQYTYGLTDQSKSSNEMVLQTEMEDQYEIDSQYDTEDKHEIDSQYDTNGQYEIDSQHDTEGQHEMAGQYDSGLEWRGFSLKKYNRLAVNHKGLKRKNSDYIGWLYIPECGVSYPVVLSKDNQDYLHTNFEGDYNYPGTIFMDAGCTDGIKNIYTILYGHNMRDGSMFAKIRNYLNQDYADKHPFFWFQTEEGDYLFRVFSAAIVSASDTILYNTAPDRIFSPKEYKQKLISIFKKSQIKTSVEINGNEKVMTLSTCVNNSEERCAVSGVLIKVLESSPFSKAA